MTRANPMLLQLGSVVRVGGSDRRIDRRAGHAGRLILRLEGCADREEVEAMRGADLFVARSQAPELGPDEWWAEDLEGCAVRDGRRPVGRVRRLVSLPSCEVLEVQRSPGEEVLMVPLIGDAVRTVDVVAREIDIDLKFLGET